MAETVPGSRGAPRSRSVYVVGMGAGAGKATVALGLAELLSRQVARVGVFRRGQLDDAAVRRVVARLVDTVREVPVDGGGGAWIELGMSVARRDGA